MIKNSYLKHNGTKLEMNEIMLPAYAIIFFQFISIGRPHDIFYPLKYLRPGILSMGICFISALIYWRKVNGQSIFQSIEIKRFRNIFIRSANALYF